jgi:hypothetical protein
MNREKEMVDTCQPNKNKVLNAFRVYSIVVPSLLFVLALEVVYICMNMPGTLGNAKTVLGKLPKLPSNIKL